MKRIVWEEGWERTDMCHMCRKPALVNNCLLAAAWRAPFYGSRQAWTLVVVGTCGGSVPTSSADRQ